MDTHRDLTRGPIANELVRLALPIMATSLVQMAYNLTDLLWLGRVGSGAVAAVGTVGFFMWFGMALCFTTKVGAEITVSQALGAKKPDDARGFTKAALTMALVYSIIYALILFVFGRQLLGFFRLDESGVGNTAYMYMRVITWGIPFAFISPTYSGIYNALGDSRTPFYYTTIGLVANIVLDPILIFGWGPFPALGAVGAAIATVFAQMLVFVALSLKLSSKKFSLKLVRLFDWVEWDKVKRITRLGLPVAMQSAAFSVFSMVLARILTRWGTLPIAAQKVGTQVEAVSWLTAGGFSSALAAFTGQNFGAGCIDRVRKSWAVAMGFMTVLGILTTAGLVFFPGTIFSLFITEPKTMEIGVTYLRILGYSQLFMIIEITTSGGFNGLGRTMPPTLVGVFFTGLRVPAAFILAQESLLGLEGVWWSVSISSLFKGTVLVVWYWLVLRKLKSQNCHALDEEPHGREFTRYKSSS